MSSLSSKRIAIFIPSLRGGGAERAMLLFAQGLLTQGYSVDFLVAQAEGPLLSSVPIGVRLVNFNKRKVSHAIPALVRYLRSERPAALYSTIVNANLASVLAHTLSQSSSALVLRESNLLLPKADTSFSRKISGTLAPYFYRRASSIISVSEDVARELESLEPRLRNRISVLPNPAITEEMFQLAQSPVEHPWIVKTSEGRVDKSFAEPLFLGVGRLHPQKDFPTLIRAFAELRKRMSARLLILGEGAERGALEQLIQSLGLEDDISLPGFMENPFPFFACSNVFVLSSLYEGMPNVLLQAMAFGTPVIAMQGLSGAQDILNEHPHGELVTSGDPRALAGAMERCLKLPRSQQIQDSIAEQYSVQRATNEYLRVAGLGA